MKKHLFSLKMVLFAVIIIACSVGANAQVVTIMEEDFSSITKGNNTTNSSSSQWKGNDNIKVVLNAYEAGGAVKIGASKKTGSLTTKELDLSVNGGNFFVSLDVKGWTRVEGDIKVSVIESGQASATETITYTATMNKDFENKIVSFTGGKANSTIKIETTKKRAFIDNIKVYYQTEVGGDPNINSTVTSVELNAEVSADPVTNDIVITGSNLTADISATISGEGASQFALSESSISQTDGFASGNITVTYTPTSEVATHNAQLILQSSGAENVTVELIGNSRLPELLAPQVEEAQSVTKSSFTAKWNSVKTATGYKLNVYETSTQISEELVKNGGFEDGGKANWNGDAYEVVSTEHRYEKNSLHVIAKGREDLYQEISFNADGKTKYVLSYWYIASDRFRIHSSFTTGGYTGDNLKMPPNIYNDTTKVWKEMRYVITPNAGENTLRLEFRAYKGAEVYLDGISFGKENDKTHISGSPFTVSGVGTETYDLSGLSNKKRYLYNVQAVRGEEVSLESKNISVILVGTAVNNSKTSVAKVWTVDGKVAIEATAGEKIDIFSATGELISSSIANDGTNLITLKSKGFLIVKVNNRVSKIIL